MNFLEATRFRSFPIHRLALIALVALSACSAPPTPTRLPRPTPVMSPTPSFMEGTKDLNCEEAWNFITPNRDNPSRSVFPGGHSQWWVGRYRKGFRNGGVFFFSSGIYDISKDNVEFVYRCSPYQEAKELYDELKGK